MFSNLTNLLFFATALLLLLFVKVVYTYNYFCEMESCSNPERHIFCLYPNKALDPRCNVVFRSGLTANERQLLLKLHVEIRKEYAARVNNGTKTIKYPQLFWDHGLAEMAQRWADQCKTENDECRSTEDYGYIVKQNIGYYSLKQKPPYVKGASVFDFKTAVKDWAHTPLNPANPAVSKYQAIDRIGCGLTVKSQCDYSRPKAWLVDFTCRRTHVAYIVCNYSIIRMRLNE